MWTVGKKNWKDLGATNGSRGIKSHVNFHCITLGQRHVRGQKAFTCIIRYCETPFGSLTERIRAMIKKLECLLGEWVAKGVCFDEMRSLECFQKWFEAPHKAAFWFQRFSTVTRWLRVQWHRRTWRHVVSAGYFGTGLVGDLSAFNA